MDCPACGKPLQDEKRTYVYKTLYGKQENGLHKHGRVFYCKSCGKYFRPALRLVRVDVVK